MERRFSAPYWIALIAAPVAAGLRIWALLTDLDESRLPVMGPATIVLSLAALAYLVLAVIVANRSKGRSGRYDVLYYGKGGAACAMIAALMIGLGTLLEFLEALRDGPSMSAPLLALVGMVATICLFVAAGDRRQERKRHEPAEVLPVAYLLIKLLVNFKAWSTDPIILDYLFRLFALIFALIAFFLAAGFVFDQGKPRRTVFFAMGAVFFCAAAVPDGLMDFSLASALLYGGFLLWQLPALWDLSVPREPDAAETPKETK